LEWDHDNTINSILKIMPIYKLRKQAGEANV